MVPQLEPLLPAENTGMMPAARHAATESMYHESCCPPLQELLTASGAFVQSGWVPSVRVGHVMNSAQVRSANSEHEFDSQPLHAIHSAPGALPMSFVKGPGPSPPTIVPIVCVPWPLLSQATFGSEQMRDGSRQL